MAVIWQKCVAGKYYEVRKAGQSTRLYTDGVFHSQYNPNRPITRGVWDLLMLPAFFRPPQTIKHVLVLGAGGGAVIHLLNRYIKPDEIIAIELSAVHLSIARRFFAIKPSMAKLIKADAVEWLQTYQGAPFDMIIDDLFVEGEGDGERAVCLDADWLGLLNRNLSKNGVLVANVFSMKELRQSAYYHQQHIRSAFQSVFSLRLAAYENVIAAYLKCDASARVLRQNIASVDGLNRQSGPDRLQIQIRNVGVK